MGFAKIAGGALALAAIGGLGFFYYTAETVGGLIDLTRADAEISDEAVNALYTENRDGLAAGYQKGSNEIANAYTAWAAAATGPANPGVHSGRYMMTYVNETGHDAYIAYSSQNPQMPIGTKIAKETFFVKGEGEFRRHPLFTMEKVGLEAAPETDGWIYGRVNENGRQMPTSQSFCHSCHTGFKTQDFLGYPAQHVRIGYEEPDTSLPPARFSAGDATRGEAAFQTCASCHNIGEGVSNAFGPVLTGVVGRPAGSYAGYAYSAGLQQVNARGLVWTEQRLFEWLENPSTFLKTYLGDDSLSSKMPIGFDDPQMRNDIISYLLSTNAEAAQ